MAGKGSPKGVKQGGRKPGTPNKATAEIKTLAAAYSEGALKELARLSTKASSEQARVAAIKEILDRAYGKAPQAIAHAIGGKLEDLLDALTSSRSSEG